MKNRKREICILHLPWPPLGRRYHPPRRIPTDLCERGAGIMGLAPVPSFGTRLEPHRPDVRSGDNEVAPDAAHGESRHR